MEWKLPRPTWAVLTGVVVIAGVSVCWSSWLSQPPAENAPQPVVSTRLETRFRDLMASYQEDQRRWFRDVNAVKTDAERDAVVKVDEDGWARKAWALVQTSSGDPATLEACCQIATNFAYSQEATFALARLRDAYFREAHLGDYCPLLALSPAPQAEQFLRAARTEHADTTTRVRAGLALAHYLRWQVLADHARKRQDGESLLNIYLDPDEEARLVEEVEEICQMVMDGHAEKPWLNYDDDAPAPTTMGQTAAGILASIEEIDVRRLAVGQVAPEVAAIDSDGVPLKLSEFRGNVMLLSFSGQHCVPCRMMIPHERDLQDRLNGRPFALIGFDRSEDKEAEDLKVFLVSQEITWRVCPGRSQEGRDIFRKWNVHSIPMFYLIDDRGVIRQRFDGYTEPIALGAAVESLLKEAEERVGSAVTPGER